MGKGTIISGGTAGQYQVQVNYRKDTYEALIASRNTVLAALIAAKDLETDERRLKYYNLQILSVEKSISYLEDNFPDDETISAWCADLTEDLSGEVGTVEVPGEVGTVQIHPGYVNAAAYSSTRDGQRMPTIANTPEQAYYNLAILPGWQKWMPTFRHGEIMSLDGDLADITLEDVPSSQQSININQETTLTAVTIEYMTCNGTAFSVGDSILIKFEDQDFTKPKVVGFKDNPQSCDSLLLTTQSGYCFVWDFGTNAYATSVTLNVGGVAVFPVLTSAISDWLDNFTQIGTPSVQHVDASNPVDPVYAAGCVAESEVVHQAFPHLCRQEIDQWNCSLNQTVNGVIKAATKVGERSDYQSSSEDYYKTTWLFEEHYPYGNNTGPKALYATSLTNVGGTVRGNNSIDRDNERVGEDRIGVLDPALLPPCADTGWAGIDYVDTVNDIISISSPFSDAFTLSFGKDNISTYLNTRDATTGDQIDCDIGGDSESTFEDGIFAGGVIGSDEAKMTVSWYYWKYSTREAHVECLINPVSQAGPHYTCVAGVPTVCTVSPTYDAEIEHVNRFIAFSDSTENDPNDLDPFSLTENAELSGAVVALMRGAVVPDAMIMKFLT